MTREMVTNDAYGDWNGEISSEIRMNAYKMKINEEKLR